jgi:23S rRNA pseudouridine2605 synthase
MRINKFLALATGMSRRAADKAIAEGNVMVNGRPAILGQTLAETDKVQYEGRQLDTDLAHLATVTTIMLNKPAGYVVSRNGQGSPTVYDLLPPQYDRLKPIGRLDKDSSGLLLLTNDGRLAHELTHPSRQKVKVYMVTLDKPLRPMHHQMISDYGVQLDDGPSQLRLDRLQAGNDTAWQVTMHEGRNRQIRRTFAALGYTVTKLHRTQFGPYTLGVLASGKFNTLQAREAA